MYSRDHALLSLAVAGVAVVVLDLPVGPPVAGLLALAVGVGIDVDHFLIARVTTGRWDALRRCLRNPRLVLLDQDRIFDADDVTERQRLLSHVVVAGLLVPTLVLVDTALAVFVAAVLYVHLLADLAWDNYRAARRGADG